MNAVISLIITAGRNIITSLLTKTFGIWLLKKAAKGTKTMVDDNLVALAEAGLDNDKEAIVKYAQALVDSVSDEIKNK